MITKVFAGGIKNNDSTSYVNCTMQILLHFRPFISAVESYQSDDLTYKKIINIFQCLAKESQETTDFVNVEPLISIIDIDPHIFFEIFPFFHEVMIQLPEEISRMFYIDSIKAKIQKRCTLQELIDIDGENLPIDNSAEIIVLSIIPQNEFAVNIEEKILIANNYYYLYAFVQIIGDSENGHYFVTFRDSFGWVRCNDTSIIEFNEESVLGALYDKRSPITLVAYVRNIENITFQRKEVILKNVLEEEIEYEMKNNNSDIEIIDSFASLIYNNNYRSLFSNDVIAKNDFSNHQSNFKAIFFDAKSMECKPYQFSSIKKIEELKDQISEFFNHKANANRNKDEFRYLIGSQYYNELPSESIFDGNTEIIVERKNMPKFDVKEIINTTFKDVTIYIYHTSIEFTGKFVGEQTVKDVKNFAQTFIGDILKSNEKFLIYFYLDKKYYGVCEDMKLKEIFEEHKSLDFTISMGLNEIEICTIKVPYYSNKGSCLKFYREMKIDLKSTGQDLIDSIENFYNKENVQFYCYDSAEKQFKLIAKNESLVTMERRKNVRIQRQIKDHSTLFIYKDTPFMYYIENINNVEELERKIKRNLKLEHIKLDFKSKSGSLVKNVGNPRESFDEGLYFCVEII